MDVDISIKSKDKIPFAVLVFFFVVYSSSTILLKLFNFILFKILKYFWYFNIL